MIINPYAFSGGPGPSTYLDDLAVQPSAVLSLRKMISTATNAIRVRRSSDNAEQDIGFSGDVLDTSSLASFVGANSAFVTTIYDQTGNGEDAVQSTTGSQPRIVNAGSYLGSVQFDGVDDFMVITSLTQASQFAAIYSKIQLGNSFSFEMVFETGTTGAGTAGSLSQYVDNSGSGWSMAMGNTGGGTSVTFTVTSIVALTQLTALWNRSTTGADEAKFYRAGSNIPPSGGVLNDQAGNFVSLDMYIGSRAGSAIFADMFLETAAIYNLDTVAIQASIEAIVA